MWVNDVYRQTSKSAGLDGQLQLSYFRSRDQTSHDAAGYAANALTCRPASAPESFPGFPVAWSRGLHVKATRNNASPLIISPEAFPPFHSTPSPPTLFPYSNMAKRFSAADVASHKTASDLWIIVDEDVYDLTTFQDEHPGGKKSRLAHVMPCAPQANACKFSSA